MKFGLDETIINNIIQILKRHPEVESARVFGSRARGDYRKASDIDMALFGEELTHSINTNIFYEIDELYLPYNFNTLENEPKLKENILKEGIEFYSK